MLAYILKAGTNFGLRLMLRFLLLTLAFMGVVSLVKDSNLLARYIPTFLFIVIGAPVSGYIWASTNWFLSRRRVGT